MDKAWLRAAKAGDVAAMKALADHYEEQGDQLTAAEWRCKAGLSRLVYQVYNTNTGKVEREYDRMAHCRDWFTRFKDHTERSIRKIRVVEMSEQIVLETQLESEPRTTGHTENTYRSWTGPVTIQSGEFSGKTGTVVDYNFTQNYDDRGFPNSTTCVARVLIDGVEHLISPSLLKFLP
jgi:hypothetical protein